MDTAIKEVDFRQTLTIELEVKDLAYVKEHPTHFTGTRKASFYHIIWLSEGQAIFHIDFREITICAGQVLVISTNQVYEFDTSSDYNGKLILFTDSFLGQTAFDTRFLHTSELLNPVKLNQTISVASLFMNNVLSLLQVELETPSDVFQTHIAQSYLKILLLTLERSLTANKSSVFMQAQASIARQFFNKVEEHYQENKGTAYYLNLLGVGEKLLSKEIKALTNKTPKAYINSRTILEAKRLLAYSNLSVKEVGFKLGFDEATNFNKFFRKHTHTTPMQFRKEISK